jgi:type I restriction enzyme, S subunit
MAIDYKTVSISEVLSNDRFDPRFHLFAEKLAAAKRKFEFAKLKDISEKIIAGKTHSDANYISQSEGGIPFVRTGDVKKYQLSKENFRYLSKTQTKELEKVQLKPGDILISAIGNYLGSACAIPASIPVATFNQNSLRVRIIDKRITPEFLTYFLNSSFGQAQLESLHSRTGQKIVNASVAGGLEIPILKGENFTERIKKLESLELESLELIQKAQSLLRARLKVDSVNLNRELIFQTTRNFVSIESMWTPVYSKTMYLQMQSYLESNFESFKINEVARVFTGDEIGSDNYVKYSERKESMLSFVRTTDFVNFQTDPYPDFYVDPAIAHELSQEVSAGDILFSNDGKIGQVAFVLDEDRIVTQSHINTVRLLKNRVYDKNITPEYLFACLTIPEIAIFQAQRYTVIQSTIPTISSFFESFSIPLIEQENIDEITSLLKQAFNLKNTKLSMMRGIRAEIEELFNA